MKSFTTTLALWAVTMAVVVHAHIEIQRPPPINSRFDPQTPQSMIDYSMTSPLFADGSNFPCKGYNTPDRYSSLHSVDTLVAGSQYTVTLTGSATHNGGSCQISVSYDQGKTFAVIHSVIGGCLTGSGMALSFPVPKSLPSASKATLAWTWFNFSGNREMYMDCSIVDITGGSGGSFTGPALFRANTFADGTCINSEGQDMVFPNPGPSVQYSGSSGPSSAQTVLGNCNYNNDADVTIGPSGGVAAPPPPAPAPPKSSSSQSSPAPALSPTSPSTTLSAPASFGSLAPVANAAHSATSLLTVKEPTLTRLATSTAAAAPAVNTPAPAPAPPIQSSASSSNDSEGGTGGAAYLRCDTLTTFSLCGGPQGCVNMGSVAAGTECVDGQIVHAGTSPARRHKARRDKLLGRRRSSPGLH